jgi:hypothetical protein
VVSSFGVGTLLAVPLAVAIRVVRLAALRDLPFRITVTKWKLSLEGPDVRSGCALTLFALPALIIQPLPVVALFARPVSQAPMEAQKLAR